MGRDHKRRSELLDAMERAVEWYHERLLRSPDAGPARDYLRSRGYDGDVVRQFRLGWAPDDWDAMATSLKLPENVLSDSGLGFVNRRGRVQDFFRARVLFPICDPSGRPGRARRAHPAAPAGTGAAGPARAEVQELAGVADLLEAPHPLRAQLGQEGRHRPGRGRGVRGLHRRHRLFPGRRAVGRRHLWHRAGRGALHPAAQLRQAHRAGVRRRRGRAECHLARLRVGAQARGRRGGGGPSRRQRPGGAGPHRPDGAGPRHQGGPALPAVPGGPHAQRRRSHDGRGQSPGGRGGPHGRGRAPRRPGSRPVRDAAGRPVPRRFGQAPGASGAPAGPSSGGEAGPAHPGVPGRAAAP